MDLVVYDDAERRYVPWGVVLSALLLVAAVVGALTFLLGRSASGAEGIAGGGAPEPATAPADTAPTDTAPTDTAPTETAPSASGDPSPVPACAEAVAAADVALERSGKLAEALAAHTRLMDQLLAGAIPTEQVLDQTLPVLTTGATDRRQFEEELAAYERLREECPTR